MASSTLVSSPWSVVRSKQPLRVSTSCWWLTPSPVLGLVGLTGITPVLVSEVSASHRRGGFLGYVFIANYLDISVAYWLSFGLAFVNNGYSDFRWRFLLAFQSFPALLLPVGIRLLPESPRYYSATAQFEKAKEVLTQVRGDYPTRWWRKCCLLASK
jgi:Sugar (and other) transporter